jgi:hypothetical protein
MSSGTEFLIGQGVIVVIAVLGFLSNRRGIGKVHTLVNDRSQKQDLRIEQLTHSLTESGTDVPDLPRPTP